MTRKEDCIGDMESGMPWKELLSKYPKSTVYNSIIDYYKIAERKYSDNLKKNQEFSQRIRNQESILKENEKSIQAQEKQEPILIEKISQLDEKKTDLKNEVANLENLYEDLSSRIRELEEKGITLEVFEDILKTDIESSEDLTRRVQTRQQYEALVMKTQNESETLE